MYPKVFQIYIGGGRSSQGHLDIAWKKGRFSPDGFPYGGQNDKTLDDVPVACCSYHSYVHTLGTSQNQTQIYFFYLVLYVNFFFFSTSVFRYFSQTTFDVFNNFVSFAMELYIITSFSNQFMIFYFILVVIGTKVLKQETDFPLRARNKLVSKPNR